MTEVTIGRARLDDPFYITGPACISLSFGRTSAMMLKKIIDAHGGSLPDDIFVCFANTGKEREETLRFGHDCATHWGVKVHWLEFITDLRRVGAPGRFNEVGYNSASRNGEPLDRLIKRKGGLFSTIRGRWCTQFCKVGVIADFMETQGYPPGTYTEVIGFRADEKDRVIELPLKPRNVKRLFAFPLAEAGVRKADVFAFWETQPFDLQLPRGTGNCDHCPFLAIKARVARARINPEGLDWWEAHERQRDFMFGRESMADIRRMVKESPVMLLDDIESDAADSECGAWCEGGRP